MQIRFALPLCSLVLAAACAHVPPPAIPLPFSDAENHILDRLKAPITPDRLDADNQTLEKVLDYIADHDDINIIVNWAALGVAGVEKSTPITIHVRSLTLGEALSNILGDVNATTPLDFAPTEGVLHISTKTELAANFSTRYIRLQYDVQDLISLPATGDNADRDRRIAYLMNLIMNEIAPNTWNRVLYPDTYHTPPDTSISVTEVPTPPETRFFPYNSMTNEAATGAASISAFNTSLIITQTPEIQAEIRDLLKQLRGK